MDLPTKIYLASIVFFVIYIFSMKTVASMGVKLNDNIHLFTGYGLLSTLVYTAGMALYWIFKLFN